MERIWEQGMVEEPEGRGNWAGSPSEGWGEHSGRSRQYEGMGGHKKMAVLVRARVLPHSLRPTPFLAATPSFKPWM